MTDIKIKLVGKSQWAGGLQIALAVKTEALAPDQPGKDAGDTRLVSVNGESRVLVSLGAKEKLSVEMFRRAGGGLVRWLAKNEVSRAALDASQLDQFAVDGALKAFCEGLLMAAFKFDRHKSKKEDKPVVELYLLVEGDASQLQADVDRVQILVRAVNLTREWDHEPPNVINPVTLAQRVTGLGQSLGLKITVFDDRQLEEMGAGALVAVGKGSAAPSRLIVLEYPGQGDGVGGKPVVLVGKAITFDTGGYSLKINNGMVGMKFDKSGAMAVIGALQAAAELRLKTPVVGIVSAAENMISGGSYRPDDILTTLSGKTVEVVSSDAEGRLVLSDALTYAQQAFQPRAVIDLATLTGGVVVALGNIRAGLFSNDEALAQALIDSGEQTFERLWRLPMDEEYFEGIKSDDADFKNSGARNAAPIIGAIFLKQFIEEGTSWAHIDIAGTADLEKDMPYTSKGSTGFGVRLLIDYLQKLENQGS